MRERRLEPEYHSKQQSASEHRERTQRHDQNLRAIAAITAGIDRIAVEQQTNRDQRERHETGKRRREQTTIAVIAATAITALITLGVTHCDTVRAITEARIASDRQHDDTVAALAQTNVAISETRRLADAAKKSSYIAEDTEIRQLRAYVFPVRASVYNVNGEVTKVETEAPRLEVYLKNTRITPAYRVINIVGGGLLPFPTSLPKHLPPAKTLPSMSILASGGEEQSIVSVVGNAAKPLTTEQKVSLNTGTYAIFLSGEITYYDAFNILRCSRYRYYVGGDSGFNGTSMKHGVEGQEADEDCLSPD
jgi:hypothetical protein